MTPEIQDGVRAMVPRERMTPSARKLRDIYAGTPDVPFFRREFGYYCLDRWREQGLPAHADLAEIFDYDPPGNHDLGQLGWCEAQLCPPFETRVIEDRGEYELVRDSAGRHVLCFKGRRDGFMPEYVAHPVQDRKSWETDVRWRMNPQTPARFADLPNRMAEARQAAAAGLMIVQNLVGGYMYLRSLMGPEGVLYALHDQPDLVHDCMRAWCDLADAVIARHQQYVTIDEIFLAEDICYNHGSLISPEMMKEFLFPYYQQVIGNLRSRQLDKSRPLYVQVDTDGLAVPVICLYQNGIGMNVMSPFEVAAGCDVVRIGRRFPDLVMFGGIDKRVLARGRRSIDEHLEYILPAMRKRGGYSPTCDHGVPEEVSLDNYRYYRRRCVELGG